MALAVVVAAGCGAPRSVGPASAAGTTSASASPSTSASSSRSAAPAQLTPGGPSISGGDVLLDGGAVVLPNRSRTPGATNPAVTQTTIRSTICLTGYTKSIRPASSYTTGLKRQQLATGYAYHGDESTRDYEEDHLISLELGGAASDPRNLWPEPYFATDGARVKDLVESKLHDLVCSGALSLAAAQQAIATNWWSAYQTYGGEGAPQVWYGRYGDASGGAAGSSPAVTAAPAGATAQCSDGTYSYSQHRSGTCSHHGGVARWINQPPS